MWLWRDKKVNYSLLFYPVIINNSHVCIQIPGNKLCFSLTLFSHYFLILLGFSLSAYVVQVLSNYRSCNYLYWGRILGRNPDKSPKSFPPCYSQSPQLCLEISISFSNSCNLLFISTVKLLYTVQEKGGNPDRKPYPLLYGLRNSYRNLKSENAQDYALKPPQNCTHEFGFWYPTTYCIHMNIFTVQIRIVSKTWRR